MNRLKERLIAWFSKIFAQRKFRRGFAFVLFFILINSIISTSFIPQQVDISLGEVSKEDIYSPKDLEFEDVERTDDRKEQAAAAVDKEVAYEINEQITENICQDILILLDSVQGVLEKESYSIDEKAQKLQELFSFDFSQENSVLLASQGKDSLVYFKQEFNKYILEVMDKGVLDEDLDSAKAQIINLLIEDGFSQIYLDFAKGLLNYYLKPNLIFYEERYNDLQEAARDSVSSVIIKVRQGEKIIGNGEIATEEHMKKLQALGLTKSFSSWQNLIGISLLVLALMLSILAYVYQQNRKIYKHKGYLYLLGIIVLLVMLVGKVVLLIDFESWPELSAMTGYLIPFATAGMLIAVLLDAHLAVLVVASTSFLVAYVSGGQTEIGFVGFLGGFTGVYSVGKLKEKRDLIWAGISVGFVSMLAIMIMGIINETPLSLFLASSILFGFINGLISSILTIGILPYLENLFRITSSVKLLELSQPSNPLLKLLMTDAPGSYHHSILVANLAEAATEEIGGDSLLARVGAYYHDIGKIKRPYFFIENQMGENPHDKIVPRLSALILNSHVKDGLELAKEYNLPLAVQDIILQHHGVSLMGFFYHKAVELNGIEGVNEDEFRYEGPKPQTKEAAVVMLADTVEAAVRSLHLKNHNRIENMVRKLIKDKLMDGQLDECELTLKDLDTIAQSFLKILSGMFHGRMEYPELTLEIEGKNKNGNSNK